MPSRRRSQSPVRDETTDQDVNYEWAKAELQKAQVEMKGLAGARGDDERAAGGISHAWLGNWARTRLSRTI